MYQNYHRHSHYSNILLADSVATNEDYAKRAIEQGHQVLSSCEHGTQGNYFECASLAERYSLKWRYVSEAYFVHDRHEKDKTNAHIILAAKTRKGTYDLNYALSEANISGYYFRPRIDMEILLSLDPRDVFVTTACVGGVFKYGYEEAEKLSAMLASRFKGSFMLEVQYHDVDLQKEINGFLLKMYRKYNVPLIMGCDSHFIRPEDKALRDQRQEANHIVYADESNWYMDYPTDDEAFRRFVTQGILSKAQIIEAMENTNIFLSFEDVVLERSKKLPTIYPELSQEERNQKYETLVFKEWEAYSAGMSDEEKRVREEGIRYEVDTITGADMSDYFLLDQAIVKRAKEKGAIITKTARGSSASYFTNTLLGLSSVDRFDIPVTMYPDRFISKDRLLSGATPDIDLNVSGVEAFAEAQAEIIGEWRSAPMVAFGTLRRLSAWKMYCRANDVPFEVANGLSERLKAYELDVKHADEEERDGIDVFSYIPEKYHEYVCMSEKYLGMIDSISPHPCAYLLCREDIRREIGIFRINSKGAKKKTVYAAFIDGATADAFGYLKNDGLSVDTVLISHEAYKRIGRSQPSVKELLKLTEGDKATWTIYAKGLTMGINQMEQEKTSEKGMRYKPRNITELAAFVAAVRPSFQSMQPTFLARRPFSYGIPVFDKLIQTKDMPNTFILFQEMIMKTLQYGGFTAPESYATIKAIAKKHPEKVLPMKEKFLAAFHARILGDDPNTAPEQAKEAAEKVWRIVEDATAYGFCASHAVCVAQDSLYGAYAKAHWPLEFYTTLLSVYEAKGDKDRIARVKEEMKRGFGITVAPCLFRQDNRGFYIDRENNRISDAISSVKHISKKAANELYKIRDSQYETFTDLLQELEMNPAFDARSISILIKLNYFREFGTAGKLLKVHDEFRSGDLRFSKSHIEKTRQARLENLRDLEALSEEEETSFVDQIQAEIEYGGTPISVFPERKGHFAVLDVDDRYSLKIRLYNIAKGTVGVMKVRKPTFRKQPLKPGDVIRLIEWQKKPAYHFVDGKPSVRQGVFDLWMEAYTSSSA